MKMNYLIVVVLHFNLCYADQSLQCGDWDSYKDEKCFKVIDKKELKTYSDAKNLCYQNEASGLVSLRSQEEQDFVYNLLRNVRQLVNDVWIGAQYSDKIFKCTDNTVVNFTNWPNNYPRNDSGYDCIQMSMDAAFTGKWLNEPCDKLNVVVCQKEQNWLFSYLQKTVMDLRESYENLTKHFESTRNELENIKTDLNNTKTELRNTKSDHENTINELRNTKSELESTKALLNQVNQKVTEASPAGTIAYFSSVTSPSGWLKANGQQVLRSEYASLFAVIGTTFGSGNGNTTFTLPDLRGEFIRGWSDGRDVDSERSFGSIQLGSSVPMAGYVNDMEGNRGSGAISSAYHDRWGFAGRTFDDGFEATVPSGQTRDGITYPDDNSSNLVGFINTVKSGVIKTWNVFKGTRPRNIALVACIKY